MSEKGSNLSVVKQRNSQLIREIIYENGPVFRTDIAQKLFLSLPTITTNVARLVTAGVLYELPAPEEEDAKQPGRPPVMLDFVPDYAYFAGVELGPYKTSYVLTDLRGKVLANSEQATADPDYDTMLEQVSGGIRDFLAQTPGCEKKLRGVGVCLPGFINIQRGYIHNNLRRSWNNHHLAADLQARIRLPVLIENNIRARAIGCKLFRKDISGDPMLYYFVSYGLGCALIVDGKILRGASAGAGEVGHMVWDPDGPVCEVCGNQGCLDVVASESAILRQCKQLLAAGMPSLLRELCPDPEALSFTDLLNAYEFGDKVASIVVSKAIRSIGLSVANLANFISPKTIVIDSRLFTSPSSQNLVQRTMEQNVFGYDCKDIQLVFLPHDPFGGAIGGTATAIRKFFIEAPDMDE